MTKKAKNKRQKKIGITKQSHLEKILGAHPIIISDGIKVGSVIRG